MDELDKSFPAAEGFVDAEQSGKGGHHNENCLNCGEKLIDTFCHHCGQKDIPRRQTLGELFSNFISSFWSYEGKFFLTTKYILTKPGFLSIEYNAGRRESYYHPARMYVFISFVFFLLAFSLPEEKNSEEKPMTEEEIEEAYKEFDAADLDSVLATIPTKDSTLKNAWPSRLKDSLKQNVKKKGKKGKTNRNWNFSFDSTNYKSVEAYGSAQKLLPENKRDGWLKHKAKMRGIELDQKYKGDMQKFSKEFGGVFKENFSKVLFYLLPFFALVLKLLYVRRDFYYSEHLVFSIYYYNFFFLAGCIYMLINLVPGLDWLASVLGIWIYLYLLFAMKRMYEQSWKKTILKFFVFTCLFSFFALIAVSINALATLMIF